MAPRVVTLAFQRGAFSDRSETKYILFTKLLQQRHEEEGRLIGTLITF